MTGITPAELAEILAVCDFIERSPNLNNEDVYVCEDRHGRHALRVSVLRRLVAAFQGECPAGGEHDWDWTDSGDSGARPYRWVCCQNCGTPAPPPDPDDQPTP